MKKGFQDGREKIGNERDFSKIVDISNAITSLILTFDLLEECHLSINLVPEERLSERIPAHAISLPHPFQPL